MARQIANYRDLQDAVSEWLNRSDLDARIPTFIYLAERKLFRRYRAPNNEKTLNIDWRVTPDLGDPLQLPLDSKFQYPGDYLEMLTVQANGVPLDRISLTELQTLQLQNNTANQGEPAKFARERLNFHIYPAPQGDTLVELIYYCDLSGQMETDASDNDVLRSAPDLYLYGTLMQAQPFLKPEEEEFALVKMWQQMYNDAFAEIERQRDDSEFSGSVVAVKSAFSR